MGSVALHSRRTVPLRNLLGHHHQQIPGSFLGRWKKAGLRAGAVACAGLFLAGCELPAQVTKQERLKTALADLEDITRAQEPVYAPLDMYEAMARALKYNLDRRIRNIEQFYAAGDFDLAKYNLLPTLDIGGGYKGRNSELQSTSQNNPTTATVSQDRNRGVADARILWSTLDFGVSYLKMKQRGNAVWIAGESERKATNRILADTRRAYWRAVAAEKAGSNLAKISAAANAEIRNARVARANGDITPEAALDYEKRMLATIRDLEKRQQLLALSRAELASLINIDPATPFSVVTSTEMTVLSLPADVQSLRLVALIYRPELYEHDYKLRIAELQRKIEIFSTLPSLGLDSSGNYDSNSFLVNNAWLEFGARLSAQLNKVITLPRRLDQADAGKLLVEMQRKAMTLSVVTQVQLAIQGLAAKKQEFELTSRLFRTESNQLQHVLASAEATVDSRARVVEARASHAVAQLDYSYTYAELQEAYAQLLASVGIDTVPGNVQASAISTLSGALRDYFEGGMLTSRLMQQIQEARETQAVVEQSDYRNALQTNQPAPAATPGAPTAPAPGVPTSDVPAPSAPTSVVPASNVPVSSAPPVSTTQVSNASAGN